MIDQWKKNIYIWILNSNMRGKSNAHQLHFSTLWMVNAYQLYDPCSNSADCTSQTPDPQKNNLYLWARVISLEPSLEGCLIASSLAIVHSSIWAWNPDMAVNKTIWPWKPPYGREKNHMAVKNLIWPWKVLTALKFLGKFFLCPI